MELDELRKEINEVDNQIVSLFKRRMAASAKVAKYKKENNLPVLDRARERELLKRISDLSGEELSLYSRQLYSTVMGLSRTYQHKFLDSKTELSEKIRRAVNETDKKQFPESAVVACQGVEGAYSSIACEKLFKNPDIMFFESWDGVFSAVSKGLCKYGVLPIENSTAGSVNHVYDLMRKHNFYIVRSIRLKVDHSLLVKKGTELSDIKEIFSHEQAINQCSEFLSGLDGVKITVCENTAAAAKTVAESGRRDIAAVSSADCAELYNLSAVSSSIQNRDNNYTRFICIAKELEIYPGADKTSIMMTLPHRPGSLYSVLSMFYALDINLLKLESRPLADRDFEFMFYFDIEASVYSEGFTELINELESGTDNFSYMGSYSEIM